MNYQNLIAQAQSGSIYNPLLKDTTHITNPTGFVGSVIRNLITLLFIVGILYFIWHFLFAAYHLIGSTGDSKKLDMARTEFEYSVIGLIAMFSVFVIIKVFGFMFGIQGLDNLQLTLPTL